MSDLDGPACLAFDFLGTFNKAQFDRLRESGCDLAQGFWLAEPTDAATMTDMLRERRAG